MNKKAWDEAVQNCRPALTSLCRDISSQTSNPDEAGVLFSALVRGIQGRLLQFPETQQNDQSRQVEYLHEAIREVLPDLTQDFTNNLRERCQNVFTVMLDKHFPPEVLSEEPRATE